MDPVILTVLFKGLGMLLVIIGGVAALRYGFHLYKDGAGTGPGDIAFELGRIKVKARSAGATVMATAFLWAWIGTTLSPNLDRRGGDIRVYSFTTPHGDLNMQALAAKVPRNGSNATKDPQKLKNLLERAVEEAGKNGRDGIVEINGQSAKVDLSAIDVTQSASGKLTLSTKVLSSKESAVVKLEPRLDSGTVTFYPTGVEVFGKE
ncbi:hypothetical protein LJR296_007994 [Cupriavidus necator]|uniref:hypothetical protein n=1 Tax=Cupriavidus necator TaxID=106590 RepID=UPI003ECFD1FC